MTIDFAFGKYAGWSRRASATGPPSSVCSPLNDTSWSSSALFSTSPEMPLDDSRTASGFRHEPLCGAWQATVAPGSVRRSSLALKLTVILLRSGSTATELMLGSAWLAVGAPTVAVSAVAADAIEPPDVCSVAVFDVEFGLPRMLSV